MDRLYNVMELSEDTIWKLIDTYFQDNPQALVRHHIESYNDFFKNGIFQIFKEKNKEEGYLLVRVGAGCNLDIDPSDPESTADNSFNRIIDKLGYALF